MLRVLTLAAIAAATAGFAPGEAVTGNPEPAALELPAGVDPIITGTAGTEGGHHWTHEIRAPGSQVRCLIDKSSASADGVFAVTPGAACGRLHQSLGAARFWKQQQDGTVAILDGARDTIAEFAIAEGVALESYWPRTPLLSLAER